MLGESGKAGDNLHPRLRVMRKNPPDKERDLNNIGGVVSQDKRDLPFRRSITPPVSENSMRKIPNSRRSGGEVDRKIGAFSG